MKTYTEDQTGAILIVGETDEIRSVEKSMRRAWRKDKTVIAPSHLEIPRYRSGSIYGISVDYDEYRQRPVYHICSADTVCRLLELA